MKITLVKINNLNPAEYNPRQISNKQYEDLKASMEKFGCVDPIIININPERLNVVVGGHQRLRILRELGAEKVPTVSVNLSEEDERELNVRLNKSGGEWDMDILANEFDVVDLKEWGFKDIELGFNIDKIVEGNTEDDHIPEVKESRVKLGEVWQLGKHRLMCGDSTKESDVNKLMNGDKADILFTSPPYNVGNCHNFRGVKKKMYETYTDNQIDYSNFLKNCIDNIISYTNYQFINIQMLANNKIDFIEFLYYYKNNLVDIAIWDKIHGTPCMEPQLMNSAFEFVIILNEKNNPSKKIKSGTNFRGNIDNIFRLNPRGKKEDIQKTHGAVYPVEFALFFIETFSKNSVVDLFLGSGTTLIACEKTNRICYGMELDTKYCDVIIERWEQFTGQKAKKCGQ